MTIRPVREADIDRLVVLNEKLVSEHIAIDSYYAMVGDANALWKADVQSHLRDPNSRLLVAEEDGRIVGYLMGSIRDRYKIFAIKKYAEVWSSYVEKDRRRQGIMKKLFSHFMTWVQEHGVEYCELNVDPRNQEALKTWDALGFEQFKARMKRRIHSGSKKSNATMQPHLPKEA